MRLVLSIGFLVMMFSASAQEERDSTLNRCPVFITDTATSNNFFIEGRPCTIRVNRDHGELKIVVEQRDQFLTLWFPERKLRSNKYKIQTRSDNRNEIIVKYSFRSGDQVSYVNVSNGTVETKYDKASKLWAIKVNGTIANLVDRTITYYRVRADFNIL